MMTTTHSGTGSCSAADADRLMRQLRDQFVDAIQARAELMRSLASALRGSPDPGPTLSRLVREAHTLKGSAGTFGFPRVGEAAGEVERAAREAGLPPALPQLDATIDRLWDVIRNGSEPHGDS